MGFTSALVFYIVPGFLGRAYNIDTHTVGPDLFDVTQISNVQKVLKQHVTISEYKLVSDLDEAKDFLDVSGQLALKIKNGNINIEGAGSYIKQASSFHKKVELLVKVHYETETIMLPSDVKPLDNYRTFLESSDNTHYIRSITYGGNLVASVSFLANSKSDLEKIKGTIQAEMQSKSGSFSGSISGKLDKIEKSTNESASISINYFATVPLKTIPRNIKDLVQLVEEFPEQAKQVNEGRGVPIRMEIFTLKGLNAADPIHHQSAAFTNRLSMVDEQLTDLKVTRRRLNDWMQTIPPKLTDELNEEIAKFSTKLQETSKVFDTLINTMDISQNGDPDQFNQAYEQYKGDKETAFPDLYVKELSKLKTSVLSKVEGYEPDFGGAMYTVWGDENCPSGNVAVQLEGTKGTMASTIKQAAGTTEFMCLTNEVDYPEVTIDSGLGDPDETPFDHLPEIKPIQFKSRKQGSGVLTVDCVRCRIPGKSTVAMFPGQKACPDKWTLQYSGVLVSTDFKSVRSENVCLRHPNSLKQVAEDRERTVVTEVTMSKQTGDAIACAVCSSKNEPASKSGALNLM